MWAGVNNTATELSVGGSGQSEDILYDNTVSARFSLMDMGQYGQYYQYIVFPQYTAYSDTSKLYTGMKVYFTCSTDAYVKPQNYNAGKVAHFECKIQYDTTTSYSNGTNLYYLYNTIGSTKTNIGSAISGTYTFVPRKTNVFGINTYTSSGTGTTEFNIHTTSNYYIQVYFKYGYSLDDTIYNNTGAEWRIKIVGIY